MGSVGQGAARCAPRKNRRGAAFLRPRFEPLESRAMLAVLGMGIQLRFNDDNGTPADISDDRPGAVIPNGTGVEQGDLFWVDVLVEDKRDDPQGVISLPVNYYWDPAKLQLAAPPTAPGAVAQDDLLLTPDFVLQRFVDGFDANGGHVGFPDPPPSPIAIPTDPNIENLRGGALPNIGSGAAIATTSAGGLYGQLQFRALATAGNTPFTVELAGSMSFADADSLDGIGILTSPEVRQQRSNNAAPVPNQELLAVTEFIQIVEMPPVPELASLSGFVYIDTNPTDGVLNRDNLGVAVEFGVPNVTLSLFLDDQLIDTTTTGADGAYLFEGLEEGVYSIIETQPPRFISTSSSVGVVLPSGEERGVATSVDQIDQIDLDLGDHGIDYNFGETVIPDKRMFLSGTDMRRILAGQRGVEARTVKGTSGDDTILVESVGQALRVTVNSQAPQQIPLADARILYLDARGGQDTVEFRGGAGDEVANLSPGTGAMRLGEVYQGANYAVMAVAAERVVAHGGGGDDLVVVRDSPGDDALVASGNTATLTSADTRLAQALAFERVRALSETRPGSSDQDTADVGTIDYVLQTVGKWQLI